MSPARCLLFSAASAAFFPAIDADAQYYRGRRNVIVRAPFVGVNVTPGGVQVRAPFVNVNTAPRVYPYGVVVPGPVVQQPAGAVVAPTPAPVYVAPATGAPVPRSPVAPTPAPTVTQREASALSEADLAELDQANLLAALSNRAAELNAELGTLSGGEGWQSYLALPESTAAGAADAELLGRLLARFDSVARERQFGMVAGLAGFEPMRTALRVAVDRVSAAPMITPPAAPAADQETPAAEASPAAGEALPLPAADDQPAERSVLQL